MKDKKFIQSILDKIGEFGDGELKFETRDIERLCNIALKAVKNNAVLPPVVERSEQLVCPHCKGKGEYIDTHPERCGLKTCECQRAK